MDTIMVGKRVLLLLGGLFHDFDGFEHAIRPVLVAKGHSLAATYDLDTLAQLGEGRYDLVMSYTSLSRHREGQPTDAPETLTAGQTKALADWVRSGGALLGIHSATVSGQENRVYQQLLGGRFVEHPPQFAFTVYPMAHPHPITDGVDAFTVVDELYIQEYDPGLHIHMITLDRGVAYPLVWSRTDGKGRVAHITMGHSAAVWSLPQFSTLVLQAIDWLTA